MIEWINNRFGTNFTENDLGSIKDFALAWNIFENLVCNNSCSVNQLAQRLNQIDFEIGDFTEPLEYFKNRYVSNGVTNGRFEHLNFRPNDRREIVEGVLLGQNNLTRDIVFALSIIVFRYRNNLFHGLKQIENIDQQRENFENANLVLTKILRHF